MKKHGKLHLSRQTLHSLDSKQLERVEGARPKLTRISECEGDGPCGPPPQSGHCITDP